MSKLSPFFTLLPVSDFEEDKRLGGKVAGTADPNRPKGYPMLYNVMLINKTGVELAGACHSLRIGWALG